jgi:hypothetical protein
MSKLFRRSGFVLSMTAVALVLLVGVPAGASAAAEEPSGGSTSAGAVVEPSGDSAPPASTEWSPQGSSGGAASGGAAPLQHGSSVGSGVVTGTTGSVGSDAEAPPSTPDSSASYQPEPSVPATVEEPASTPRAESAAYSVQPRETETETAPAARPSRAVDVAIGEATSLGHSASAQDSGISSVPPAAAASFTDSGDGASTSSYALPLLAIIVLGLILGFAGVRFRRRRRRRRLDARLREQGAAWEAALRRAGIGQVSGAPEPRAQRLQRI